MTTRRAPQGAAQMNLDDLSIIACANVLFHVTSDYTVHPTLARMSLHTRRYTFESLPQFQWAKTGQAYLPVVGMMICGDWLDAVQAGQMSDL